MKVWITMRILMPALVVALLSQSHDVGLAQEPLDTITLQQDFEARRENSSESDLKGNRDSSKQIRNQSMLEQWHQNSLTIRSSIWSFCGRKTWKATTNSIIKRRGPDEIHQ